MGRDLGERVPRKRTSPVLNVIVLSAVVLIAAAPLLCLMIFGSEFRGSVRDLRILGLGAFGIAAIKQLGTALTSQNRPRLETPGSSWHSRSRP